MAPAQSFDFGLTSIAVVQFALSGTHLLGALSFDNAISFTGVELPVHCQTANPLKGLRSQRGHTLSEGVLSLSPLGAFGGSSSTPRTVYPRDNGVRCVSATPCEVATSGRLSRRRSALFLRGCFANFPRRKFHPNPPQVSLLFLARKPKRVVR